MKRTAVLVVAAALVCAIGAPAPALAAPSPAPSLASVQDPPKPDERADVKEWIAKMLGHASKRGKEDQEAIAVIDQHLLKEFENFGPKDRASVVKALDKVLSEKRQEDADGVRQNSMFIAAAVALGRMGPESAPVLADWIGHKSHKKDIPLQRKLIESLGRTKVESERATLIKLITDDESQIQAAAIEALAQYSDAEQKHRKETFEAVLKHAMSLWGAKENDRNDPIARERFDAIAGPAITTLRALSGQDIAELNEWQRWWNKNKKEEWPQP